VNFLLADANVSRRCRVAELLRQHFPGCSIVETSAPAAPAGGPFDLTITPLAPEEGRPAAAPVTPRRLVELFQALLDHLPLMVAVWGLDGQLALVNPALERTLGWSLRDSLEHEAFSACYPDPVARQEVLAAIAAGYDGWREFRVRTRWGQDLATRWLVLRLDSGLRVCIGEDISSQREAEERLGEQAALLDSARDAIVVCDLEDRIVSWNRGAERLYGWAAVEVLGLRACDVLGSRQAADWERVARQVLECGEWHGELEQLTRGGEQLTVDSSQTLLRDADGRPRARLAINTDVTEKKRLEAQIQEAQRLESLGRLAGGMAHELNNALTPLRLGIDYLLSSDIDPAQRPLLETMLAGIQRGTALIQRVQAFARGGGGLRQHLELVPLLADVARMLRQSLPPSITLEVTATPDLWPTLGDADQLRQVLLSLAANARDAMPQGGRLTIQADNQTGARGEGRGAREDKNTDSSSSSLAPRPSPLAPQEGRHVRLKLADTGCGMTPAVRQRLFDPFFTTKEIGQGSGLGLAMVRGIIKAHGGFIEVTSAPGAGTTIEVYLPAEAEAAPAQAPKADEELPQGQAQGHGQGQWLLVVDDEPSIRELARTVLETFGYSVLTAGDGQQALEVFRRHAGQVRLALVDMMMPVLDGPATIHALRTLNPKLAVIAASGLDSPTPAGAASLTLQGYLRKPYSAHALLAAVRKVLDAPAP
jgi:PAS domain S-box-containing protein